MSLSRLYSNCEVVYLIAAYESELVKIGVTTNLKGRLNDLQVGSPLKLYVLAACIGEYQLEHALHTRFEELWSHGEWFFLKKKNSCSISQQHRLNLSEFDLTYRYNDFSDEIRMYETIQAAKREELEREAEEIRALERELRSNIGGRRVVKASRQLAAITRKQLKHIKTRSKTTV